METMIVLDVRSCNAQKVEATAFSRERANIYIKAATLQEATALLSQGEEKALEACRIWKPEPQPAEEKPQKHYKVYPVAVEDLQQTIDEYQKSEQGSRFVNSIQKAKAFTKKKDASGGLSLEQLDYLVALTYMDEWKGLKAMYDFAYRRGYNKGKATKK